MPLTVALVSQSVEAVVDETIPTTPHQVAVGVVGVCPPAYLEQPVVAGPDVVTLALSIDCERSPVTVGVVAIAQQPV